MDDNKSECVRCGASMCLIDGCEWPDDGPVLCWGCQHEELSKLRERLQSPDDCRVCVDWKGRATKAEAAVERLQQQVTFLHNAAEGFRRMAAEWQEENSKNIDKCIQLRKEKEVLLKRLRQI